ncbi:E3 ubiquitin-protein ligase ZNF598 [Frankliniella fusca]|uniref:RING-type E3 ubiquitin transferase n=1 Tax=Frankliniella fusca TaxID=407009 RepID=A0AAE1GV73_9NEOP|nr:E3 ubiquitin-protein ligase ZNF598 [Frankliniella fusca]
MSTTDNTCVVCFKTVEIYSIGVCDHPVCYECSTRMRVLCRQNECPICRQDLPKVIFSKNVRPYKEVATKSYPSDKEFKILFDGGPAKSAFEKLLQHECSICGSSKTFNTFQLLKDHMRKSHELFYCDLCVDNLKIFSHERRVYTRQDLAHHRRKGDVDDRSHKGHPLCQFCDQRYMDNDELFRHLRKDHLFCHFCDADGLHQYYSTYDVLREHFKKEHFLCEEGTCYEEQFTSAFRSEIDLKAHRASSHSRSMGKQAAKQARTLEVEFTLAPRRERIDRNFRGGDRPMRRPMSPSFVCNHAGACNCNREDTVAQLDSAVRSTPDLRPSDEPRLNPNDFPSLGGNSSSTVPTLVSSGGSKGRGSAVMIRAGRPPLKTDENFPALSEAAPAPSHKVWLSVNSRGQQDRPTSAPTNFSIQVNRRQPPSNPAQPQSSMQTLSSRNVRMRGPAPVSTGSSDLGDANFPALKPLDSYRGISAEQWISSQPADGPNPVRSKVSTLSSAEAAQLLNNKPSNQQQSSKKPQFVIEEDFPSLGPSSSGAPISAKKPNVKKASSVTIPMSNSWSQQARDNSPEKSSDSDVHSSAASNTKSKKKKKKSKNVNVSESADKKVLSEQTFSNASSESSKKKKKQKQQPSQDQEVSKERPNCQNGKLESNDIGNQSKANQENRDPIPDGSQGSNSRKRSELQIESLHINETQSSMEDTTNRLLSILRGDNALQKSSASSSINPPPGFELPVEPVPSLKSVPPPGFSVKVNSVPRSPSNQLTFTSSSGESYPILPTVRLHQFVQPPDFQRRNAALMARVIDTLKDPSLQEEFRQMSILFRQGQLSAASYYKHCVELMGEKAFNNCFPEMLVLLPEIDRQQDLLAVYSQFNSGKAPLPKFEVCASCRQVLAPSDLRVHASTHSLENNFPALSSSESLPSAWNRK